MARLRNISQTTTIDLPTGRLLGPGQDVDCVTVTPDLQRYIDATPPVLALVPSGTPTPDPTPVTTLVRARLTNPQPGQVLGVPDAPITGVDVVNRTPQSGGSGSGTDQTARDAAAAAQSTANAAVPKAGGTLTGPLTLSGDPTAALHAAPRQYVLAQIQSAVSGLVNGAPGALDTLGELAAQLASDETAAGALTTLVGTKAATAAVLAALAAQGANALTAAGALITNRINTVDGTTGAFTATLPTDTAAGAVLLVEKVDAVNTVTLTGRVRGTAGTTIAMALQRESVLLVSIGSGDWWPIAGHKTLTTLDARYPLASRQRTGVYVPSDWGQFWKPKLTAAKAGTGKAIMAVMGDSVMGGLHYPSVLSKGAIEQVRAALQGTALGPADGGSGFAPGSRTQTYQAANGYSAFGTQHAGDALLIAQTGTWSIGSNWDGPGAVLLQSNAANATLTYKVRGTSVTCWFSRHPTNGNGFSAAPFTVTIDGAAQTQVVTDSGSTADAVASVTYSGLTDGDHTVVITNNTPNTSTYLLFFGVSGERANGVVVNNFSAGGRRSGDYVAVNAPSLGTAATWSGGASFPCDLLVYALGVNDAAANTITAATWAANVAAAMDRVKSADGGRFGATDLVFLLPHVGTADAASGSYRQYAAAARGLAEAYGAALVDVWTLGRNNWRFFQQQGLWGDAANPGAAGTDFVHLSDAGQAFYRDALLSVIA